MIKYVGPIVLDLFWFLCILCWKSEEVPDGWRGAVIVPLYKGKGSQIDCASHRAISLISLGSKVYAKVLARRMQEKRKKGCCGRPEEALDLEEGVWIRSFRSA